MFSIVVSVNKRSVIMSVNFSTITPMSQSTISKMPTYSTQTSAQVASTPIDSQQPKKNNHWFLKTLAAVAVLTAAVGLLRGKVDMFKNFDVAGKLAEDANLKDKAVFYGKKAIAVAGDFVNKYANLALETVKGWLPKKSA